MNEKRKVTRERRVYVEKDKLGNVRENGFFLMRIKPNHWSHDLPAGFKGMVLIRGSSVFILKRDS